MTTATAAHEIEAALHRVGVARTDSSPRRRAEYSSDASLYRVPPMTVVFPRTVDEILATVEVCRALGVPLTPRGAGTSIAGNAVGPGVVLDTSQHLHAIGPVDAEGATVTVEPGVILDDVQRAAHGHGLRFGPDPSTHDRCTVGGMIGNNACGSRALRYGRTADNVIALDVVTGAGELLRLSPAPGDVGSTALTATRRLAEHHASLIRDEFGRFGRQISGYALERLLPEHGFDVAKALVGSEGTCAVVLGATLRLVPTPATSALIVLGYPDMASAADAVPGLLPHEPVAIEGLDARIIEVVRQRGGAAAVSELPRGAGWLLVELGGDSAAELEAAAAALIDDADAIESLTVTDPAKASGLWRIREEGAGLSSRSVRGTPAYSGWEDAAVPPERLGAYLREFDALLAERGLAGMPYGHFGDGCVHIRIDFPLDRAEGAGVFRSFLEEAARLVARYGGSMSGEHGDGRARSELLPLMYSEAALAAFGAFKHAFDPDDLLNPGVIVKPRPLDADLRPVGLRPQRTELAFAYADDGGDVSAAVHRCIGIGKCRAGARPGAVMCPSYLATGDERESTRGRARVLQEMMRGETITEGWRSPEVHDALDLCLACKGCASDCPTSVDMATYKAEALHQTYRGRLRPLSHYSLGWLPRWSRLASRAPRLANRMLRSRLLAAAIKHASGIDTRRSLPGFAEQTFRQWFADRTAPPHASAGEPVVMWADTFTNHFSPGAGIAAVTVLENAGFSVRLADPTACCGLTWISTGQLDAGRRILRRTVDCLAPHARDGVPIVGLEPSCTAVLRSDARELLGQGDPAAREVATATRTLAELLTDRAADWSPPDLTGVQVVAQPHCHHHAVMGWTADRALLERTGAHVQTVGGCCGLAGNFGLEVGHYDVSVAVAETSLLPAVRAAPDGALMLADGFSCRTQLDQLARRPSVHLAELLAFQPQCRDDVPGGIPRS